MIENISDLEKIEKGNLTKKFEFKCTLCGKVSVLKLRILKEKGIVCSECRQCLKNKNDEEKRSSNEKRKNTNLERYGVTTNLQLKDIREKASSKESTSKRKSTCLQRYGVDIASKSEEVKKKRASTCKKNLGVENPMQNETVLEKSKETCVEKYGSWFFQSQTCKETMIEKYGSEHYTQSEDYKNRMSEILEKTIKTNLEKYGAEFFSQSEEYKNRTPEILKKIIKTNLERYGVPSYSQSEEYKNELSRILEKTIKTNIEKFGAEFYSQSEDYKNRLPEILQKTIKTNLERYGVPSYSQTLEFHKKKKCKCEFDGLQFDSSWELMFYKYHKEMGADIEYHPCFFEYEFNGKIHKYFPDFRLDEKLIEIKGDHFMKDGEMINIYDPSQNGLYNSKFQCMIKNHIIILNRNDLNDIFEYFEK